MARCEQKATAGQDGTANRSTGALTTESVTLPIPGRMHSSVLLLQWMDLAYVKRYQCLIADIQLHLRTRRSYRANCVDKETAEAIRRWDAGTRVVNAEEFERKKTAEQWQIVYVGTEKPIAGTEVILTSD